MDKILTSSPARTRTCNLLIRSQVPYPIWPRALRTKARYSVSWGAEGNTSMTMVKFSFTIMSCSIIAVCRLPRDWNIHLNHSYEASNVNLNNSYVNINVYKYYISLTNDTSSQSPQKKSKSNL